MRSKEACKARNQMVSYLKAVIRTATVLLFINYGYSTASAQDSTSVQAVNSQSRPINLTQAINVALANNTDIKRSLLNLENADEQIRIAWSEVLPDVSASASYTRNLEIPVNFVPAKFFDPNASPDELVPLQFGTDNNWNGGFSVRQTLFKGEAVVGISSSQLYKSAQAENLRSVTQQIVTNTRLAYYNVLVAEEQYRLQQASVDRLRENLKDNKARNKAGLVDEYTVMQVEVQLKNQEPQLTQAKYGVSQAYRKLKLVLGLPLNLELRVEGDLSTYNILAGQVKTEANKAIKKIDQMTPYSYEANRDLLKIASNMRGDIRILDKQEELKEKQIMAIKSRFLPTLSATYNLNWAASQPGTPVFFGTSNNRARSQTLGLTLSLPIFEGFKRSANVQIARIEEKDLKLQKKQVVRSANDEIQSAREALNQAIETAPVRKQALELARDGYRRAQARLDNGIGSQIDVTEAEFQLRQAEVNYAQMVYNYLSAKARYDQAIGMVPFVDKSNPELD